MSTVVGVQFLRIERFLIGGRNASTGSYETVHYTFDFWLLLDVNDRSIPHDGEEFSLSAQHVNPQTAS